MTATMFGHYRLDGVLGRGGMGEVYRAFDTEQERVVALKVLPASLSGDEEYRKRFRREARLASQLTDPHIVPIHRHGEIDGQLYLDMRLVEGDNLASVLRAEGPLHPEAAVRLVEQVGSALDAAHDAGLIHRDVKPSNVFLTRPSRTGGQRFAYLGDFGIARAVSSATDVVHTATGSAMGTLDYMAPERFLGRELDSAVDVYALGCLLHECLTGRKPFPGEELASLMHAHLSVPPPRPSGSVPVPFGLDSVVERGMAKDPRARHRSAGELAGHARAAITAPSMHPRGGGVPDSATRIADGPTPTSIGLQAWDGRAFGTGPARFTASPQRQTSQPQPSQPQTSQPQPSQPQPSQPQPHQSRTSQPRALRQPPPQPSAPRRSDPQQDDSTRSPSAPQELPTQGPPQPTPGRRSPREPAQPQPPEPALPAPPGYGRSGFADVLAVSTLAAFVVMMVVLGVLFGPAGQRQPLLFGTIAAAVVCVAVRRLLPAERPLFRVGISMVAGAFAVAVAVARPVGGLLTMVGIVAVGLALVVCIGGRALTAPDSAGRRRVASLVDGAMMAALLVGAGVVIVRIVEDRSPFGALGVAGAVLLCGLRLAARPRRDQVLGVSSALCVALSASTAGEFVFLFDSGFIELVVLLGAATYVVALVAALWRGAAPASPR